MAPTVKILVVDDFEVVRLSIKIALKELGYTNVVEASDGRIALQKIHSAHKENAPFDVVFCDWNMPEISGLQVIEACRKEEAFKALPIILVTAEGDRDSVVKALKSGASDYILKPVVPTALEKRMQKIMTKFKAA